MGLCRASWDSLGHRGAKGQSTEPLDGFVLTPQGQAPMPATTQPRTTTRGCHTAQPRTEVHYSQLLSRKTEKRKYDFCLNALMLTLLILSLALPELCETISATLTLYSASLGCHLHGFDRKTKQGQRKLATPEKTNI